MPEQPSVREQIPHLNIVPTHLKPCGDPDDPTARLSCDVWMMGSIYRIDAIAVTTDAQDTQIGVNRENDEMLNDLDALTAGDGHFQTHPFRLEGIPSHRRYVIFMTPHRD